jgi:hypothetical protein
VADQGKLEAETMQEYIASAKTTTANARQALEAGDGLAAEASASEISQDIRLLQLAVGSGIAIFNSVQETTGSANPEEVNTIEAQLEAMQDSLDILAQIDPGQTDFTAEIEAANNIEAGLQNINEQIESFRHMDSNVLVSPFRSEVLNIGIRVGRGNDHQIYFLLAQ